MTAWPGVPLPLPPVVRRDDYWLHESEPPLLIGRGSGVLLAKPVRLGEIYLELARLDLDDPGQIVGFAQLNGVPSGALAHEALRDHSWFTSLFSPRHDATAIQAAIDSSPDLQHLLSPQEDDWQPAQVWTMDSFALAARLVRDLSVAWRVVQAADEDADAVDWALPYRVNGEMTTEFFALHLLEAALPRLLTRFHPRIGGAHDPWDGDAPSSETAEEVMRSADVRIEALTEPLQGVDLVELCALELHNHIVSGEVYRTCQNINCARPFVRQYGREQHGMSKRQGVLYCSHECANATASRNYRRRKSLEKARQATSSRLQRRSRTERHASRG